MDFYEVISNLTGAHGVTGNENAVAECVLSYFREYTSDVWRDRAGNVFGAIPARGSGNAAPPADGARPAWQRPVILVCAHMDEIGMVVNKIEENGMLRLCGVAGVDPRTLPGNEVVVHASKRDIKAVIGATPPHLLPDGAKEAYKMDELICDTGLTAENVRALVEIGDFVTYAPMAPLKLMNGRIAGKTLDDRALVAAMIRAMEILKTRKLGCTVIFCATVQEEKGGLGATTAAWGVNPDMGIAIDVTHAPTPGTPAFRTTELDKIAIDRGGNIHPKVYQMLIGTAKANNIEYEVSVHMGNTGTDAWNIQIQRAGIPCGLISLPLRYMHTSVETISLATLENCAKLVAEFIACQGGDWEEALCLND